MSKVILECDNVSKKINKQMIVEKISFSVKEGEILGFIGPNGSGKTTTIKLILNLYKMDSGYIKINNYDLKKNFKKAISSVGAIIENPDMYMYLSGYENLILISKLYNIPKSRVEEVIELVGLKSRIHDKVSKYSLGMRQRLGIAQAIIHNPNLLILDEPTNGLDPSGIHDLKKIIKKLAKSGMAIIVSSHILSELESFCTKVCFINNGKIIKKFKIDDLKNFSSAKNYIVELDTQKANLILADYSYQILDREHLKINISTPELNNFIYKLVINDIQIKEIKKEALSLEDIFIQTVGGNFNA